MKLDISNVYLQQKGDLFIICLAMPDASRNYLHSQVLNLDIAIEYRDELIDYYQISKHNLKITKKHSDSKVV